MAAMFDQYAFSSRNCYCRCIPIAGLIFDVWSKCARDAKALQSSCLTQAWNGNSALQVVNIMSRAWPAIRWTLDKLLRLAATATALIAISFALIGGPMIDRSATTPSLIAGLSITVHPHRVQSTLVTTNECALIKPLPHYE